MRLSLISIVMDSEIRDPRDILPAVRGHCVNIRISLPDPPRMVMGSQT